MADEIAFGARRQHDVRAGGVDRRARRTDALDRMTEIVEGLARIAGGVLDREPGDAGRDAAPDILGDRFRLMRVARLEIGIHRQVGRRDDLGDMGERVVERHRPVRVGQTLENEKPELVVASALKPRWRR